MKKWRLAVAVMLAVIVLAPTARAQTDVTVQVVPVPPFSPRISVWRSDPSKILVTLINNTATAYTLRLSGHAASSSGSVTITTKDDFPVPTINLAPHEVKTLHGSDLSLFSPDAVNYSGTSSSTIATSGNLPEGDYTICLRAMDYNTPHAFRSAENCASFHIQYIDPPRLITPSCADGTTITVTTPPVYTFSWIPPSPPPGSIVNYDLTIVEVASGHNANDAFQSRTTPAFFEHTFINQTSFTWTGTEPNLQIGHTYAWAVQAIDPTGSVTIRNNGFSEVCSFTVNGTGGAGSATCDNPTVTAVYPPSGATIPYRYLPVIVRFDPYCDAIHHFHSIFIPISG